MQSSSHGEIGTCTATAPATARTTKSPAIVITSISTTCLSPSEYASLERDERAEHEHRPAARARRERERGRREDAGGDERGPRRDEAARAPAGAA